MKAQLNFINFVVPVFKFDKCEISSDEEIFEFTPRAIINRKENQFHINIELEIKDTENSFHLQLTGVGIFEYNTKNEDLLLNFMSINGPAIIFPYIRSFVSNFTSLTGFNTITLPTLNLSGFKEEIAKTLIDIDKE